MIDEHGQDTDLKWIKRRLEIIEVEQEADVQRIRFLERRIRELRHSVLTLIGFVLAIAIVVFVLSNIVVGQEPTRLPTPADATGWALADLLQVPEHDRPFSRYIWIPPWGNDRWVAALNFTVNTAASHATTIQSPAVVANGWMLRYDLRRLAPDPVRQAKLIATWDGLAVRDPYFHVPAINTKLKAAVIAPHLDEAQAVLVANLSLSTGSIYRADWFLVQALSTIDGGAYYDFRQVVRKPDKGTALGQWLSEHGVFTGTTAAVGGERRAAMFRSNVAGFKPRRVDVLPSLIGGICAITLDVFDGPIGADSHPIRSLLDVRFDGSEIIAAQPNGLHDFLLADSKGNVVDEAPPELVSDHTVPAPFSSRLQPAISCIRCHGEDKSDGWQPVRNDVEKLLSGRLNVFADVSKNLTAEQVADKLAGLYALPIDSADSQLGRARRDYSAAVYRSAMGIKFEEQSIVNGVSKMVSDIYAGNRWEPVTPEVAARELGIVVAKDEQAPLDLALGSVEENASVDPVLGFLRLGVPVGRDDWESVYADAAIAAELRRKSK